MKNKVVFITIPWFVPAFKAGGPIQSIANMVYELNEGYQFYIYTSNNDLHGLPIAVSITNEWVQYNDHTKVWYAGKKDRSQQLVEQVKAIKPDTLFITGLFDWHYNIVPMIYAECSDKIISVRGMLHPGALSQKPVKKKMFLQLMKWMKLPKKIRFHATDDTESEYINKIFETSAGFHIAGNFPRLFPVTKGPVKRPGELKLVSVGIVSAMKNYLEVLLALANIKANIHYNIYGPVKDAGYWEQCLEAIKLLPPNIAVQYHPELPAHKVNSKLQDEHVFILTSKSENYGHAIAEALSAGLPVITSKNVPWLQLAESNAGINIDDGVESIKNAVEYFASIDNETFNQYQEGAANYIRERVNINKLREAYHDMFRVTGKQ